MQHVLTSRRSVLATLAALPSAMFAMASPVFAEDTAPRRFMMENATTGSVVDDSILLSKISLLFFGYTHCPDICPTSLLQLAEIMKLLGDDAKHVQPIFVTVDPARDTAEVMKTYVANFDERIVALRGPAAYTDAMVKAYNARYEIQKPSGDDPEIYTVDHTASLALIGPDGVLRKRFPYGIAAADVVKEVKALTKDLPAP
jgi:protein SCO1/2